MPTVREDANIEEQDDNPSSGVAPCVAGEFKRSALDTLFETLSDTQTWFIFCVNLNDSHSQLPNQLEGRCVICKGPDPELGRNTAVFEAGLTPDEFCTRYKEPLVQLGVTVDGQWAKPGLTRG